MRKWRNGRQKAAFRGNVAVSLRFPRRRSVLGKLSTWPRDSGGTTCELKTAERNEGLFPSHFARRRFRKNSRQNERGKICTRAPLHARFVLPLTRPTVICRQLSSIWIFYLYLIASARDENLVNRGARFRTRATARNRHSSFALSIVSRVFEGPSDADFLASADHLVKVTIVQTCHGEFSRRFSLLLVSRRAVSDPRARS